MSFFEHKENKIDSKLNRSNGSTYSSIKRVNCTRKLKLLKGKYVNEEFEQLFLRQGRNDKLLNDYS